MNNTIEQGSNMQTIDIEGLYSTLNIGYLFGPGDIDPASLTLNLAYQFKDGYSIGTGTGLELFNEPVMPVYGEIRYTFEGMKVAPFAYFQSGYSFPLQQPQNSGYYYYWDEITEAKGGLLVNPGIGVLLPINTDMLFSIGIGFRYQELNYHRHNNWTNDVVYRTDIFKRLDFRIGLCFK